MSEPPFEAPRTDSTTWSSGISMISDAESLRQAVTSRSWLDAAISGIGVGLDVATAVLDPLGSLASAGIGWLLEHVKPLSDLLDQLTGDPDAVAAQAATWSNAAAIVRAGADEMRIAGTPAVGWQGPAADAFARSSGEQADHLRAAAVAADTLAAATHGAGEVVSAVRDAVRDLISQLVATLVVRVPQWALEEGVSFGLATPHVLAAATAVISRVVDRVVGLITAVVRSLRALGRLVGRTHELFERLGAAFARRASSAGTAPMASSGSVHSASDPPAPGGGPAPGPADHGGRTESAGLGSPGGPPNPGRSRIRDALEPASALVTPTAGMPPAAPRPRVLNPVDESRVGRGADGLIETVDGRPHARWLADLVDRRGADLRQGRANGELTRTEVGEVVSVAFDRNTGALAEATNQRSRMVISPDDLHPLLRDRLTRMADAGPYPNGDDPAGAPWTYRGPAHPLNHAEVKAVNELLWSRGANAGEAVFGEFRVDNVFPFTPGSPHAPCCVNCGDMLAGTAMNPGRFTGFPPGPGNKVDG